MPQAKSLSIFIREAILGIRKGEGIGYETIEDILGRSVSMEEIKRICCLVKIVLKCLISKKHY